jgi:ankyrin repeat protein
MPEIQVNGGSVSQDPLAFIGRSDMIDADRGGCMHHRRVVVCLTVVTMLGVSPIAAQRASDRYYEAIRNNDLASLRELLKTGDINIGDINTKDKRGATPLMYAAAFGSLEAMRALIAAKADVNAKNGFDAMALLWCAGDFERVRLLVANGADVNARSAQGRTPVLTAATRDGASRIVKLLLEKGADPLARDNRGVTALMEAASTNDPATVALLLKTGIDVNARSETGESALINAGSMGNIEIIKMLLAKGADVNAVSAEASGKVKNGNITTGLWTPLLMASAYSKPEVIKVLLDAGAKVNARDVRGMTPLMLAVSSDRPNPKVVRLLLERGADPKIKDGEGETVVDWARKFNNGPVLKALGVEPVRSPAVSMVAASDRKSPNVKDAAEKSIALLQQISGEFLFKGGCAACHAQDITAAAVGVARARGIRVDETAAAAQAKIAKLQNASADQRRLVQVGGGGAAITAEYTILEMSAEGVSADRSTDAIVHYIAGSQLAGGNWHRAGVARPPMEDGDFSGTAMAIKVLKTYGPEARQAEFGERIARAAEWLKRSEPRSTEDRAMQLLGMKWAGADRQTGDLYLKQLLDQQHPDGGWAQTPELASDAYGTGQVLYTLHELGVLASNEAYARGVQFLVRTQFDDGSWQVKTRSPKVQPYFQSGFPFDHDQWISQAATAWAAMGLAYAVPTKAMTAEVR